MSNLGIGREEIPSDAIIDNRYLVKKILGQGGLGRTYLAFDVHRFNEPCVLKEFAPLGAGLYDLEKSRNLFKREAKILHCITHPQIPEFLACFESYERLFLVQEFVNGKTYSALLQERQQKNQAFTEQEVIKWLIDVLPILSYIHERGIIHRDISPDNIMQPEGEELPVLIDFGVGKLTSTNLPQDGGIFGSKIHSYVGKMSFVGKIGYAPTEQISMGKCSPSSDLYSLGVTALVLLTGKDPTSLLNQDSLEWQWQKYIHVSPGFEKFISKMIEARPLKRYQSAQETLQELEKYFANLDTLIHITSQNKNTEAESKQELATIETSRAFKIEQKKVSNLPPSHQFSNSYYSTSPVEEIEPLSSDETKQQQLENLSVEDTMIVDSTTHNSLEIEENRDLPLSSRDEKTNEGNETQFNTGSVLPRQSNFDSHELNQNQSSIINNFEPDFIRFCNQELAYFIGPMANLIVEETLARNQCTSPESFVEALAQQIPSMDLRIKFKRRLL